MITTLRGLLPVMALAVAGTTIGCAGDDGTGPAGDGAVGADLVAPEDVVAVPSAGCGGAAPAVEAPTDGRVTLGSGDAERWYLRHLPPAHDGTTPLPLVVDLHSYTEGAEVHTVHSGLGATGDEAGFVTVTPQGAGPVALWQAVPGSPDVAFVGELLDDVAATLCVDTARVFVAGLANGAMLASVLACELDDRIAAVAAVAGVVDVPGCGAGRPVPVVAFHGTEDPFRDYDGGVGPGVAGLPAPDGVGTLGDLGDLGAEPVPAYVAPVPAYVAPVPASAAGWALRNGCESAPAEGDAGAGGADGEGGEGAVSVEEVVADDVTVVTFECPPGAEVVLYRVEGGGATWPGSPMLRHATDVVGVTTSSVSANDVMWRFFRDHPLPPGAGEG